jgi:bifunctional non-homologous end joining protein LigD
VAFDVLFADGRQTTTLPYESRRHILESLAVQGPNWQTPSIHVGEGVALLEASRKLGLEGLVAKKLGSHYEPGKRSGAWLKIKNWQVSRFVVGGYVEDKQGYDGWLGSLLLGRVEKGNLRYVGRVGTGFGGAVLRDVAEGLGALRRGKSPFAGGHQPRAGNWIAPRLEVKVRYYEITRDGILRHPTFLGLSIVAR